MDGALAQAVWDRASSACEYCGIRQPFDVVPFEVDHVIAQQHGGQTVPDNLALAWAWCNKHKGPNIAGLDPLTGQLTALFNPRHDFWAGHFEWDGPELVGRTAIGRTTIQVLAINHPDRVMLRQALMDEGGFPFDPRS